MHVIGEHKTSSVGGRFAVKACLAAVLLALAGGCASFQPIPGPGRDGGLYRYTRDYDDEMLPFSLCGKALVSEANQNWNLLLPAVVVGAPLYGLEQFVLCPVVDTVLLPYDLALKLWKSRVCARNGIRVQILDGAGIRAPVTDCEISVIVDARAGYRIVYGGRPCPRGYYAAHVVTDENGEAYVPIDMDTCQKVRLEGWTLTTLGKEEFRAEVSRDHYWSSPSQGTDVHKRDKTDGEYPVVLVLNGRLPPDGGGDRQPARP